MGVHSSFFGPIKYAILPQHLHDDEVLGGTGLVEAGTYGAVLAGRSPAASFRQPRRRPWSCASAAWRCRRGIPVRTALAHQKIDFNISARRSGWYRDDAHPRCSRNPRDQPVLVNGGRARRLFPPLVKNTLGANREVATLFLALFSVGVAAG